MLARRILTNINGKGIHRTAYRLIRMAPVLYSNSPEFRISNDKQKSWSKLYPGWSRQYPIVIYSGAVHMIGMAPLKLDGYDKIFPGRLAIGNNGHTVSIALIQDNKNPPCTTCRPPTISGGLLKNAYEFEGLHFHWTDKNNRGFEHVIDNMRYPLEMHLVHRNKKYDCIEKALQHDDGLCVAAVFFDVSEMPYKPFNTIIENFVYIQNMNSNISLDCGMILDTLLPTNTQNFYTYKGSLLSPPYNKSINWIIFVQPIYISYDQLAAFQLLQKNQVNEIFENCRIFQPIEEIKVYARDPNIAFACDVPCPNIPIPTSADVTGAHVPNAIYNEMYFPRDGHSQTNKKIPYNATGSNKELLGSNLTDKHNSIAHPYHDMYFPVSSNHPNKKVLDTYSSLNNELTKQVPQNSSANYDDEMCCPIMPKTETQKNKKKMETISSASSPSSSKEMYDTNISKENSSTNYNDMCVPVSTNENVPNKLEPKLSPTNCKDQPTDNCHGVCFPMSDKNDNKLTNQKTKDNEGANNKVLTPKTPAKKKGKLKKKFSSKTDPNNVLSNKTQERGFLASFRNMIKDALIKFFSK